ncbi:hypothetical protein OAG85_03730 [Verrucomicrobiales bacterium]|nr:hypothetical protein [Verrucomicrobiales bacterium]
MQSIALVFALVIGSSAIAFVLLRPGLTPWIHLVTVMFELLFYLLVVYWLGMIIGARSSNWRRAVMIVFLTLTTIIVMPFLGLYLTVFVGFAILSPTGFIVANEPKTGVFLFNYLTLIIHFALMALILSGLRLVTFWFASNWLSQASGSPWVNAELAPKQNPSEDLY